MKRRKSYQRQDEPLPNELKQEAGFLADYPIHNIRSEADPMYRLLLFGNDMLTMSDGSKEMYVDVLLRNAKSVLNKRYGPAFESSRLIQQMFHLLDTQHDVTVKIFVVHFIIHQEPLVARAMADLYDTQEPSALFPGEAGPKHFNAYVTKFLRPAIESHLNHANNKYTIVQEMQGFVQKATQEYIMGPN